MRTETVRTKIWLSAVLNSGGREGLANLFCPSIQIYGQADFLG